MVSVRDIERPWYFPPKLILDGATFFQRSKISRDYYIPAPFITIFNRALMEYEILTLMAPPKVGIVNRVKNAVTSNKSPYPELGTTMILPYEKWPVVLKESGVPLFYVGKPSADELLHYIKATDRFEFPTSLKFLHLMLNSARSREVTKEYSKLKLPDVRHGHATKQFSAKTRFGDKFNI